MRSKLTNYSGKGNDCGEYSQAKEYDALEKLETSGLLVAMGSYLVTNLLFMENHHTASIYACAGAGAGLTTYTAAMVAGAVKERREKREQPGAVSNK